MSVAASAVGGVDVSRGGGSFRLPYPSPLSGTRTNGKAFHQRKMYDLHPLQLESYPIFVACIRWSLSAKYENEMRL